ncbi:MAG: response regulator transcription factor [Pirellulales bacterium]
MESDERFKVASEASSPAEAIAAAERIKPQLAIIDLALGGPENGLDLIKDLKAKLPTLPILVLSMHSEEMHAKHSLRSGALGYLMKDRAPELLHEAMATVVRGKRWVSEALRNHPSILEIP